MHSERGFYSKDLSVIYSEDVCTESNGYIMSHFGYDNNTYKIIYTNAQNCKISSGKYSGMQTKPFLAISKPLERMELFPDAESEFDLIYIRIHPSVFRKGNCDDSFLRVFDNMTDEKSIFDCSLSEHESLLTIIRLIKNTVLKSYSRYNVEAVCISLITQLTVLYDERNPKSDIGSTNVSVRLMNYINNHYTDKLTYDRVRQKFFISVPSINKIVKNYTGLTFGGYINKLRLEDAKMMMKENHVPVHKAAELCGFSSYNAFYRAYKKYFGNSPSDDKSSQPMYFPFDEDK